MITRTIMRNIGLLSGISLLAGSCSSGPGPAVPHNKTERQMLGLLQKFDRWDDNGDGELDQDELTAALVDTPYKAANVIDFYDTGGNRRISLREAQAGYKRAPEAAAEAAARGASR